MRKYKNSGLKWVCEIPADWTVTRNKYLFESGKGLSITKDNLIDEGLPVVSYGQIHSKSNTGTEIKKELLRYVDYTYQDFYPQCKVNQYDFIFADTSEDYDGIGNCTYKRDDSTVYAGYHSIILKSKIKEDNRYLAYLFKTDAWRKQLRESSSGVKVFSIPQRAILNASVIMPPMEERTRIADYLDKKCKEIDNLASDIKNQIEILELYKKSIITETVVKGLDKNITMKESGIQWIGKIPSHWNVIRGKYCLNCLQKPVREDDGIVTCFRDGEVTLRSKRREEGYTMSDKEIGYQGVDVGDLVVHGMDGFAGSIGISDSRGKASPVLNILDTKNNKKYFMYYLRSLAYNDVFLALATGIRVRSCDLRWNKLAELLYLIPPKTEQDMIVEYIDNQLTKVDEVIKEKKEQMNVLGEYRKSIIFEYVTGKKEVV